MLMNVLVKKVSLSFKYVVQQQFSLSFSLSDRESYTHWQRSLVSPPIFSFSLLFPLTPFFHKQQEFLSEKEAVKCFELQSLSDGQTPSVSL